MQTCWFPLAFLMPDDSSKRTHFLLWGRCSFPWLLPSACKTGRSGSLWDFLAVLFRPTLANLTAKGPWACRGARQLRSNVAASASAASSRPRAAPARAPWANQASIAVCQRALFSHCLGGTLCTALWHTTAPESNSRFRESNIPQAPLLLFGAGFPLPAPTAVQRHPDQHSSCATSAPGPAGRAPKRGRYSVDVTGQGQVWAQERSCTADTGSCREPAMTGGLQILASQGETSFPGWRRGRGNTNRDMPCAMPRHEAK